MNHPGFLGGSDDLSMESASNPASILDPESAARVTFAYTCVLGALPVVLVGAPGYWALLQRGLARWYYALALGAAPALGFLLADLDLAFWALVAGSIVALLTHLLCRELAPDTSPKPTPLRGAA